MPCADVRVGPQASALEIYVAILFLDEDQLRSRQAGGHSSQAPHRFLDAESVFAGLTYTVLDQRFPYPEDRYITVGLLSDRMVIAVWTPTNDGRRIISMRKANDREQARYSHRLG